MWIVLGIIGFLALLITVILLLPVKIILRNDEKEALILRYRFLGKTFGEVPNPDDPIVKALKTATGVDRLDKTRLRKDIQEGGLQKTVTDGYSMLIDLLKEVVALLKRCTLTKLDVQILCAGDGADEVAMHYGQCSAITYSVWNLLHSLLKIRKRKCKIDIRCDYIGTKGFFRYEAVLMFRVGRAVAALWRVAVAEAKRMNGKPEDQTK